MVCGLAYLMWGAILLDACLRVADSTLRSPVSPSHHDPSLGLRLDVKRSCIQMARLQTVVVLNRPKAAAAAMEKVRSLGIWTA